jgi:poly(3-hydroxybutyrate) depolymerase
MLSARSSVALVIAALSCLLLAAPLRAEYDILTRYDVQRPEGGRRFWLYSPTRYQHATSPQPLPLVMFFHGFSDVCEQQGYISQFSIWAYVAELHQYHLAVMCGTDPGPGWNSGIPRNNSGLPDDVAYTRASLSIIQKAVRVRDGQVFAMGHSNGAMMSAACADTPAAALDHCMSSPS